MKALPGILLCLLCSLFAFSQMPNDVVKFKVYKRCSREMVSQDVYCYVTLNDSITLSLKQDAAGLINLPVKYLKTADNNIHLKFSHFVYGRKEMFINSSKIKQFYKIVLKRDRYVIR